MWDVRLITDDEVGLFRSRLARGFGRDLPEDDGKTEERFHATLDRDRVFAAFDGDDLVGTIAAYSLDVTVPGGAVLPMGGTTIITVQPTHRRRGVLRAMMDRHFQDVTDHEEPLAGLWASEGTIYGRFGFAPATYRHNMKMVTTGVEFRTSSDGVVRFVDKTDAPKVIVDIYDRFQPLVAGVLSRSEVWWTHRVFADVEAWREGASEFRYVVHEEDGLPTGYAMYRQKDKWEDFSADGEVSVEEVLALTPAAHTGLWSFLAGIDLYPNLSNWNMAIDDPLSELVTDERQVRRGIRDAMWLRVMDAPRALEGRTYETDDNMVIEVSDENGSSTYRLEVEEGVASCVRTTADPDVSMDLDVLGHLYLGGGNALAMAAAGRIHGETGTVLRLQRLFHTAAAPWCSGVF